VLIFVDEGMTNIFFGFWNFHRTPNLKMSRKTFTPFYSAESAISWPFHRF
jgi:hypothetical protein